MGQTIHRLPAGGAPRAADPPSAEAPGVAPRPLPSGWRVLRDCNLSGRLNQPVLVPLVLIHPEVGVALIETAPGTGHDAETVLRARLAAARFEAIFPGSLPIIHLVLAAGEMPALDAMLAEGFAAQPPLSLPGGDAWVSVVERALSPRDPRRAASFGAVPQGRAEAGRMAAGHGDARRADTRRAEEAARERQAPAAPEPPVTAAPHPGAQEGGSVPEPAAASTAPTTPEPDLSPLVPTPRMLRRGAPMAPPPASAPAGEAAPGPGIPAHPAGVAPRMPDEPPAAAAARRPDEPPAATAPPARRARPWPWGLAGLLLGLAIALPVAVFLGRGGPATPPRSQPRGEPVIAAAPSPPLPEAAAPAVPRPLPLPQARPAATPAAGPPVPGPVAAVPAQPPAPPPEQRPGPVTAAPPSGEPAAFPAEAEARVVVRTAANLRAAPNLGSAVLRTAPRGEGFRVVGRAPGGWVQVGSADDQPVGWIHSSLLEGGGG